MKEGWTFLLLDRATARSRRLHAPSWAPWVAVTGLALVTVVAGLLGYSIRG